MGVALGIDLGTTAIMAAYFRDGVVEPVRLQATDITAPAVTLVAGSDPRNWISGPGALAADGADQANVVRNIKRDLGRSHPKLIGRVEVRPEEVMAHQLQWAYGTAIARIGEEPERVTVTHPANWGPEQLERFAALAQELPIDSVGSLEEPVAAAQYFAAEHVIPTGTHLIVFDVGGGTTDVAILYKAAHRFEHRGQPVGRPQLGGVDLTDALMDHLMRTRPELAAIDRQTPAGRATLAEVADVAERAKAELSSQTAVDLALPGGSAGQPVRVTRGEYHDLVSDLVDEAVELVEEAIDGADIRPSDIYGVLLAGGASRTPLIGARVQETLGLTTLVAGDPKHCVGMGAALFAANTAGLASQAPVVQPSPQGIAPDLVAQGLSGSTDTSVSSISSFRTPNVARQFKQIDDDFEPDNSGVTPTPPDRRLAVVAAVVVVLVIVLLLTLRTGLG
ncbi:MAG: Hsp70 family protein [Actinomycetota bacterium]